jgi:hypothetical protein
MEIIASPAGPVVAGGERPTRYASRGEWPRLARPEGCFAARQTPLRGKAGEPVSAPTGPDRTAAVIHYAIGDYAPTLRVGPHHTRAPPGRGTIRVHSP